MKRAKVVSLGLFSCLFLGSCYSRMAYARQGYMAKGLKEYAEALKTDHDNLEAQNALLRGRVDSLSKDAARVDPIQLPLHLHFEMTIVYAGANAWVDIDGHHGINKFARIFVT